VKLSTFSVGEILHNPSTRPWWNWFRCRWKFHSTSYFWLCNYYSSV